MSSLDTSRAVVSVAPPAAYGTMNLMGLFGNASDACAILNEAITAVMRPVVRVASNRAEMGKVPVERSFIVVSYLSIRFFFRQSAGLLLESRSATLAPERPLELVCDHP